MVASFREDAVGQALNFQAFGSPSGWAGAAFCRRPVLPALSKYRTCPMSFPPAPDAASAVLEARKRHSKTIHYLGVRTHPSG
jgi:hypothetical protein